MEGVAAGGFDKQGILYNRAFAFKTKNSYKDLLRSISSKHYKRNVKINPSTLLSRREVNEMIEISRILKEGWVSHKLSHPVISNQWLFLKLKENQFF